MRNSFLLDGNVLIYVLDARPLVVALLHHLAELEEEERPAISAVTMYEVLTGATDAEQERTMALLQAFEVLPVTDVVAARAAVIAQWQRAKGQKSAVADTFIAATALLHSRTLVTYDRRHFTRLGVDIYADLPDIV